MCSVNKSCSLEAIDSAPTDGTEIILYWEDEFGKKTFINGYCSFRSWRTEFHVECNPSHWMRLPIIKLFKDNL